MYSFLTVSHAILPCVILFFQRIIAISQFSERCQMGVLSMFFPDCVPCPVLHLLTSCLCLCGIHTELRGILRPTLLFVCEKVRKPPPGGHPGGDPTDGHVEESSPELSTDTTCIQFSNCRCRRGSTEDVNMLTEQVNAEPVFASQWPSTFPSLSGT